MTWARLVLLPLLILSAALGVTWAVLHVPPVTTRAAWIDAVQHLGDEVIAPARYA